jgi:predicted membrane protein
LFDKSFSKKSDEKSVADSNISAVFYGENSKINGDYNGGQITAAFGGVELDLSGAKIKDGSEIEVFALCGGIEISLPSDVIVENRVRGILGGSEDKTRPDSSAKKKLIVKGDCVLGGLEIR